MNWLARVVPGEEGATFAEYGLLVFLIAIALIGVSLIVPEVLSLCELPPLD